MGTTELFVELIVIGIGGAAWIVLAVLSAFGYRWIPLEQALSLPVLVPALSLVYLVGIITDRLADVLFEAIWVPGLRRKHYDSNHSARDDRRLIYTHNEYLASLIEYGRSRLRICRGWAFNATLCLVAANVFLALQFPASAFRTSLFWGVNLALGLIALLSWYTWYSLLDTQYRRLKDDAAFIRQQRRKKKQD